MPERSAPRGWSVFDVVRFLVASFPAHTTGEDREFAAFLQHRG